MKLNAEAVQALVCTVGATLGVTWMLQGRLTAIETRVEPIPSLVKDVAELKMSNAVQAEINKAMNEKLTALDEPLKNTQANVRVILKQNRESARAGFSKIGPFGAR